MICYRITKYNPLHRKDDGSYPKDEWTSFSDIGTRYGDTLLTKEEYLVVEDAYIQAVSWVADFLQIKNFLVSDLEKYSCPNKEECLSSQSLVETCKKTINNKLVNIEQALLISRLCLREFLWCRLESDGMLVHFGYDYYMYVCCKEISGDIIETIEASGLFLELYESPYMKK